MEVAFNSLLIVHFVDFAVGITTTIAMPMAISTLPHLPAESRPVLARLGLVFARMPGCLSRSSSSPVSP